MADTIFIDGQGFSVAEEKQADFLRTLPRKTGGRSRRRPKPQMSTRETPTPSASELFGTTEQRERQIEIFRTGGRRAFEQEVQRQRQETQQSEIQRRIENQERTRRELDRPKEIQPFDPFESALPLPSKRELGVEEGFFADVIGGLGREARSLFNIRRAEDLQTERGVFIGEGRETDFIVSTLPTGTIIDSNLIQTEFTAKDLREITAVSGGGAGTPKEFIVQDIEKEIVRGGESRVRRRAGELQEQINLGQITLETGEEQLESFVSAEQSRAGREFEKKVSTSPQLAFKGQFEELDRDFKRGTDIFLPLKAGAIIGGSLIAPQITAGALTGLGGLEAFSIPGRPTKTEKLQVGVEAGFDLGIGLSGLPGFGTKKGLAPLTRLELERKSQLLAEKPLAFGEVRLQQGTKDIFSIRGGRDIPGLSQRTDIIGRGISGKQTFIIPEARGISTTTGIIGEHSVLVPPEAVVTTETFLTGAKGVGFPLGKDISGTVGTGTFIDRQGVSKVLTGGVSKKIGQDLFISRTGRVTALGVNIPKRQALINTELKDLGLTKITRGGGVQDTFEIVGKSGGLRANLDQVSKQLVGSTDIVKATVSEKLGTGINKQVLRQFQPSQVRATGGLRFKTGVITKQQDLDFQRQLGLPGLSGLEKTKTTGRTRFATPPKLIEAVRPLQDQTQFSGQIQTPELKLKSLTGLESGFPRPFTPFKPGFDFRFDTGLTGGFLPPIPSFGIPQRPQTRRTGKRKFVRTPSFAGATLPTLGFKTPRFSRRLEETGLVIRGFEKPVQFGSLLDLPRKKKRRKKK
jgi:hypothetical protein